MKIYTKTGDDGRTALFQGPRVSKDDVRIEAFGTVDELCSAIGMARVAPMPADLDAVLERIQNQLFDLGAELATPQPDEHGTRMPAGRDAQWVEQSIDHYDQQMTPLANFILPGGTQAAAAMHHARVICRRAERRVVTLSQHEDVSGDLIVYLNRVGDLLFVLARYANFAVGRPDTPWRREE
jgi:cob(I)alamin adenosyltransferase